MKVLRITDESHKDMMTRLADMLDPMGADVKECKQVWTEYLAACCVQFEKHNPLTRLAADANVDFAGTCMLLGYMLAKKPWELEAQLNELYATYGTMEI